MISRIVIADDHPLFRSALAHAVGRVWPEATIIEASSAAEARAALADGGAETLLLDLHMADSSGLSVLMDLRQDYPALPIVIVSASEEARVAAAAAQLGARGLLRSAMAMCGSRKTAQRAPMMILPALPASRPRSAAFSPASGKGC